jgi:hypothetical protein
LVKSLRTVSSPAGMTIFDWIVKLEEAWDGEQRRGEYAATHTPLHAAAQTCCCESTHQAKQAHI